MADIKKAPRVHSAEFKTNVALEVIKEAETLPAIASKFSIHPTQARRWRDQAVAVIKGSFSTGIPVSKLQEKDDLIDRLYHQIGKLQVQLDWLKKKLGVVDS